ncbi:MAG: aminotransferase class I/II-fold pyridoxal phosphate-dependent enzyme [Nanoarchaeota archaeon]
MVEVAKRTENVTYAIRDVVVEADKMKKQGHKILHLNIGDPNVFGHKPPESLIEAVVQAMKDNKNGYAHSMGVQEAREAILKESERKGIKTNIDSIITTTGASEGITLCMQSLVNSGENILTPCPGYPLYNSVTNLLEAEHNHYMMDENNEWQPDIDDMKKKVNDKTKGIVIINPNNPTGALYSRQTLQEIVDIANEKDLVIFSDEIYDKLVFDGERLNATASLSDDVPVVTFGGLSKNYIAPGWRAGWMIFSGAENRIGPLRETVAKLSRARLCAPHPFQYAIKPALEHEEKSALKMRDKMQINRDITHKLLNEIEGISCVKPKGSFYAFPKIEKPIENDKKWVIDLLHQKHILVVHGTGFGYPTPDHFRVVFLAQPEMLEEAYAKIGEFVNG